MRRILFLLLLAALGGVASAQGTVYDRFYEALQGGDSLGVAQTLSEIRATGGQSAERYVAEYNYYVNRAMVYSGMTQSVEFPDDVPGVVGNVYTLSDSTGEVAGYMYFVEQWDEAVADTALSVISQGIALHPERLDMHFGKAHLLRQLRRWEAFADALHAALDYAEGHRGGMVFPDAGYPIDTVIIKSMLEYQSDLLEAIQASPDSIAFAARIGLMQGLAEHTLRLYPRDVYSLNIMAITHQLVGDHSGALQWLLKAEKANPGDPIVLSNIADTYHLLGNTKEERKYLEKVIRADGDGEYAERARQCLDELDNNK